MAAFRDSSDFIEPASDDSASSFQAGSSAVGSDYASTFGNESLVGSLTKSVYEHVYENGRRYHSYKLGRYPLPNDDKEYQRETVRNALFADILGGELHLAPIGHEPHKMIDIGTGFGDWVIDAADRYPSAKVIGVDLSPIQPSWVPGNVEFVVDDVEENAWIHGSGYDFVHFRVMIVMFKDLSSVLVNVFNNLNPGGWVEFQEIVPRIGCQDGALPDDYAIDRFYRLLAVVQKQKFGWDLFATENLPTLLEGLGFVNIQRKVYHVPLGLWPKEKSRMQQAFLFREILVELMEALQSKPFHGHDPDVGLTKQEIDTLFDGVRAALCDKKVHAYIPIHFVWAQKPPVAPT